MNQIVSVFRYDRGRWAQILTWAHGESDVSALTWSSGSRALHIVRPVLAIALADGKMVFYDVRRRHTSAKTHFKDDFVTAIKFSRFSWNRLIAGTSGGRVHWCFVAPKTFKVVQTWDIGHCVDFIDVDSVEDDVVMCGSKSGKVSVIKKGKVVVNGVQISDCIRMIAFYPESSAIAVIVTRRNTVLCSTDNLEMSEFIGSSSVHFLVPVGTDFIVGTGDSVGLLGKKDRKWVITDEVMLRAGTRAISEIRSIEVVGGQVLVLTRSSCMYRLEVRRGKVFVSGVYQLLPATPLDWDFWKGSIAFVTNEDKLMITLSVREAVPTENKAYGESEQVGDAVRNGILDDVVVEDLNACNEDEECELPVEADGLPKIPREQEVGEACGNSTCFSFVLDIPKTVSRVLWISTSKVLLWSPDKTVLLLDLRLRTILPLLGNAFGTWQSRITQVLINGERTVVCIVVDRIAALFLRTTDMTIVFETTRFKESMVAALSYDKSIFYFMARSKHRLTGYRDIEGKMMKKRGKRYHVQERVSAIAFGEQSLVVGTVGGNIISYELDSDGVSVIATLQSPIERLEFANNELMIATVKHGETFSVSEHSVARWDKPVIQLRAAGNEQYVVHYENTHCLAAIAVVGTFRRRQCPAAVRWNVLNKKKVLTRDACRLRGAIFLEDLANDVKRKTLESILRQSLPEGNEMNSARLNLATVHGEAAYTKSILLNMSAQSPLYMMQLALLDITTPGSFVKMAAEQLMLSGQSELAINVLLISGAYDDAVQAMAINGQFDRIERLATHQTASIDADKVIEALWPMYIESGNDISLLRLLLLFRKYDKIGDLVTEVNTTSASATNILRAAVARGWLE